MLSNILKKFFNKYFGELLQVLLNLIIICEGLALTVKILHSNHVIPYWYTLTYFLKIFTSLKAGQLKIRILNYLERVGQFSPFYSFNAGSYSSYSSYND